MPRVAGVYPRGCGGTLVDTDWHDYRVGLSPRVRGNRGHLPSFSGSRGSIPAGAGEPLSGLQAAVLPRVYPRGCGGTGFAASYAASTLGLSPRVRGNLTPIRESQASDGSIPAGAGEPRFPCGWSRNPRVYPRGCGGTFLDAQGAGAGMGLSPRVRGNRSRRPRYAAAPGSIPAGAGEPSPASAGASRSRVYPRGCGGTEESGGTTSEDTGLSPRVRGNRGERPCQWARTGSIPAGAGEPWAAGRTRWTRRVYPRGCGGTGVLAGPARTLEGLSPRVRGNPGPGAFQHRGRGSIPAGAGEPCCRPAA